jgi:hypothetical protein
VKVAAVSGAGSGSGKTALVSGLIRRLPRWGALKTTPADPPRHRPRDGSDYEIVIAGERLKSAGTDTSRFLEAGARRVAWLMAQPPLRPSVVVEVLNAFDGCPGLLIEGGALADAFAPGRRYVVVRAGATDFKPASLGPIRSADAVLINVPTGTPAVAIERTRLVLRETIPAGRILVGDPARMDDGAVASLADEVRAWARC